MTRKQTGGKAPAKQDTPPPRRQVRVNVKTRQPGQRRQVAGVIITGEPKALVVDERGSAYKALTRGPGLVVERLPDTPSAEADD
ncbi:hypothetical protein QWY79_03630 [Halomonas sabkhae]|uniref:hypothetical protein n=1 Tax=Halomonas sabkhae TaxID=626223 RepID=UPI0025B3ACBE|nr:hypothetical protein [Halomonas sabkhae]MDN3524353.1 hypothetical protein [Halomonas sabkhae]